MTKELICKIMCVLSIILTFICTLSACKSRFYNFKLKDYYASKNGHWETTVNNERIVEPAESDSVIVVSPGNSVVSISYYLGTEEEPSFTYVAEIEVKDNLSIVIKKEYGSYIAVKKLFDDNYINDSSIIRLSDEPREINNEECYYFVVSSDSKTEIYAVGIETNNIYIQNSDMKFELK